MSRYAHIQIIVMNIKRHFLTVFILIFFMFIAIRLQCQNVLSLSPAFSRQEIPDPSGDASGLIKVFSKVIPNSNSSICIIAKKYHLLPSPPDIQEVNYLSNGTTLNTTLWFPSEFEGPIISHILNRT